MRLPVSAALASLVLLLPATAAGEVRALLGQWDYALTGTVTDQGERLDFQSDLRLRSERHGSVLIEYEGARGGWPDWNFGYTQLDVSGRFEQTTTIAPPLPLLPPITMTERRETEGEFDDLELTLHYPVMLGSVRAGAGLTLKQLTGEIVIREEGEEPSRQPYDELFPLVHGQLRLPLGRAATLAAAAHGMRYDGNSALEWRVAVELRFLRPLLLEAGWQEKRYDVDAGDYALDAELDGWLVRAGLLFD